MSDAFTAALRLCKPEVGADEAVWGGILNTQTFDMIDEAVGGYVAISVASGNVTLSANNGATDQARNAVIKFTGSPGTDRTITAPVVEKTYWLINGVGDSSNILFKATGGSTVTIPAGFSAKVYTDGTTTAVIIFLYGTGTFTPSLAFGGASVGITYTNRIGTYTRVGNIVTFSCRITLSANGSSAGTATITGLPFTAITNVAYAVLSAYTTTMSSLVVGAGAYVDSNSTNIILSTQVDGSALTDANFTSASNILVSGSYFAA